MSSTWTNPWKLTAVGMGLVMATALVTGLVVANWSGTSSTAKPDVPAPVTASAPATAAVPAPPPPPPPSHPRTVTRRAPTHVASATHVASQPASVVPTQAAVDACNQQAAASQRDKTMEVVKDAAIGAVVGAAVGAAGGAVAGGGKGAGKGAAIGGIVGAGGGSLYGLNENHKRDEAYRAAYAACMQHRGYGS